MAGSDGYGKVQRTRRRNTNTQRTPYGRPVSAAAQLAARAPPAEAEVAGDQGHSSLLSTVFKAAAGLLQHVRIPAARDG
jgi:hypothetical protein